MERSQTRVLTYTRATARHCRIAHATVRVNDQSALLTSHGHSQTTALVRQPNVVVLSMQPHNKRTICRAGSCDENMKEIKVGKTQRHIWQLFKRNTFLRFHAEMDVGLESPYVFSFKREARPQYHTRLASFAAVSSKIRLKDRQAKGDGGPQGLIVGIQCRKTGAYCFQR